MNAETTDLKIKELRKKGEIKNRREKIKFYTFLHILLLLPFPLYVFICVNPDKSCKSTF